MAPGSQVALPHPPHLARLHQIRQGLQHLVGRHAGGVVVQLVQVDVVGLKPLQAGLAMLDDALPHGLTLGSPGQVELGGQHPVVATPSQRLADVRLALALPVSDGGVDEINAQLARPLNAAHGLLGCQPRRAEGVAAQPNDGNAQIGGTQGTVLHDGLI